MARLEFKPYDGFATRPRRQAEVTLSRRNLLALLHKLDMPGSARRIENKLRLRRRRRHLGHDARPAMRGRLRALRRRA